MWVTGTTSLGLSVSWGWSSGLARRNWGPSWRRWTWRGNQVPHCTETEFCTRHVEEAFPHWDGSFILGVGDSAPDGTALSSPAWPQHGAWCRRARDPLSAWLIVWNVLAEIGLGHFQFMNQRFLTSSYWHVISPLCLWK